MKDEKLLTAIEFSFLTKKNGKGKSPTTIYNMIKLGELRHVVKKKGLRDTVYIPEGELEKFK